MKRTISATLLLSLLLAASMTACGNEEKPSSISDSAAPETTQEITTVVDPKAGLPKADFEGETFTVLAGIEAWQTDYVAEETGDILNDAVYARNIAVEEMYNINLVYDVKNGYTAGTAEMSKALQNSVMAGDVTYDLLLACTAYTGTYIMQGVLSDLNQKEHLDFTDAWWYHNVISEMSVGEKLYIASGGAAINALSSAWGIFFNKEILNSLQLDNPYALVNEGKWTLDAFKKMASTAYSDLNGNGVHDGGDRFGFVYQQKEPFDIFPYAMGRTITKLDADGIPQLTGVSERIIGIMDSMSEFIQEKEYCFSTSKLDLSELIPIFSAEQALFITYPIRIVRSAEMREAPDFGILPMPKYDEAQDQYYNQCFMDIMAIPALVKNDEMSQLVMNALNCISYYDVLPMYKETVLQRKLSRDDDSAEMIDIIIAGAALDFGTLYYQQIEQNLFFSSNITSNQSYATWWAANESKCQKKLEDLITKISELEN